MLFNLEGPEPPYLKGAIGRAQCSEGGGVPMIIGAPPLAASIIKGTTILAQCTAPLDNNIFFLLFNKKNLMILDFVVV